MPWKELARIALLGTENSSFSKEALQSLKLQGIDIKKEAPLLLAEGAALYAQLIKAGFKLNDFTGLLPEAAKGAQETTCSPKSMHHLQLILDGKFAKVFPEFMQHLLENGKRLPTEHIPALMNRSDINEWWDLIEMSLSTGGRWLIAQHSGWQWRVERPGGFGWQTGTREQRLLLLRYLRSKQPGEATELLQNTWPTEAYKDKKSFLKELENGLSAADEPLLELALADRRKEVREVAAALLAKLPQSAFSERMYRRAADCISFKNKKTIVEPPDEPDEMGQKDGIKKIAPEWKGGKKAGYLGQVFSKVPPKRWEQFFDAKPAGILKILDRTDWTNVLLLAMAKAAVFHHDEQWMGALLEYWFENENSPLWNDAVGAKILKLAAPEPVNHIAIKYLNNINGLPEEDSPLFQLLQQNDAPWENELTMLIIDRLRNWMAITGSQNWDTYHYDKYLEMAGLRAKPALFDFLKKDWKTGVTLWYIFEKNVEDMLNVVQFRKGMIAELEG